MKKYFPLIFISLLVLLSFTGCAEKRAKEALEKEAQIEAEKFWAKSFSVCDKIFYGKFSEDQQIYRVLKGEVLSLEQTGRLRPPALGSEVVRV